MTSKDCNNQSCIKTHKPKIINYRIGEIWVCPTCGKQWERVELDDHGLMLTWTSPPRITAKGT